jgi:23S rRNA G2069 N7-methylase RlmK/C1962 C5-methylase RlmI
MSTTGTKTLKIAAISDIKDVVYLKDGFHKIAGIVVFDNSIASVSFPTDSKTACSEVIVKAADSRILGRGLFNDNTKLYKLRMLSMYNEAEFMMPLVDLLSIRLQQALNLRISLGLCEKKEEERMYRLVNSEGDRLSGLIIDVFGNKVVVQSRGLWCEIHREKIEEAIQRVFNRDDPEIKNNEMEIIWQRVNKHLEKDGWINATDNTGTAISTDDDTVVDDDSGRIVCSENGILYNVNPMLGQKTGFYMDQRENRQLIQKLAKNKTVLDMYCYTGGFSVNALKGGAKQVIAVDSSEYAINTANKNLILNNINSNSDNDNDNENANTNKIVFIKDDAITYMKKLVSEGTQFDMVILDPPKLAPNSKNLKNNGDKIYKKYRMINTLGMKLVKSGGIMLSCTCSGAMTNVTSKGLDFQQLLRQVARDTKRHTKTLQVSGSAMDHPVNSDFPQGAYLTAVLLHVL